MIAAVSSGGAPGYENLSGYFLGGGPAVQQPVSGVPSALAPSARMGTRPGQQPPGAKASVPTSSQKPGNREGNQRIPYARFQFEWQEYDGCSDDLQTGDVCFVHKMSQAMGHGFNRRIKVTSLSVLNKMLRAAVAGVTTLDMDADPTLGSRVLEARKLHLRGDLASKQIDVELYKRQSERLLLENADADAVTAAELRITNAEREERALKDMLDELDNAKTPNDIESVIRGRSLMTACDWRAVTMLDEWTLDGVVINVDDEVEPSDKFYPKMGRDDGILVNACVQGPTPMRNTPEGAEKWYDGSRGPLQHVDKNLQIMDKVFVGLIGTQEIYNEAGEQRDRWHFQYKLFTGCQLAKSLLDNGFPHSNPVAQALAEKNLGDFGNDRLWGAWRVGSVMDTHLSRDSDCMMQVNVCVEWWSGERLREEYMAPPPAVADDSE